MTYKNKTIAEKFGMLLDQINPDIVHIQHLLYLSADIIEETRKRNIPIVFTLNDYWLICPQGQLLKIKMDVCDMHSCSECADCILYQLSIKKNVLSSYYLLKRYLPENLIRLAQNIYLQCSKLSFLSKNKIDILIKERIIYMKDICSKIDLFISPSEFLRNKFIEYGIKENQIVYLKHGLNSGGLRILPKKPYNKLRFGFIGNLMPAKGVHVLIESFNKIKNENAELRIYGRNLSYKSIMGNYLKYVMKIAKNNNIRFMGGFDNGRIGEILSEIDILIVPSIWYENSPLVIQEAFACKTPVIASNIGGIPELINDGMNGLLFKPNDVEQLCESIKSVIEHPRLIEALKQNIEPPKTIEQNAKEIENVYKELLR
jgi:glycosyltransferase involved in cell wall biosynthesis